MKLSKTIKVLLLLNLVVFMACGVQYALKANQKKSERAVRVGVRAQSMEHSGVMSAADYKRSEEITERIVKTRGATDAEVKELLRIASRRNRNTMSDLAAFHALYCITGIKKPSPTQREDMFQFAVNEFDFVARSQKVNNGFLQATTMMSIMKEKRAVPYLLPFVSCADPRVADAAKTSIQCIREADRGS